jgi:predicted phage tail protein
VLDLHVKDAPPAEPAPASTPTTETPAPAPAPTTETPATETSTPPTAPAVVDRTAPAVRSVRVTRLARALRTRLRLSERARLTVTVKRGRRRVARVQKAGVAGRNTVNVRRALGPGRYTVIVQAVDLAGNRGKSVAVRLTVPRG